MNIHHTTQPARERAAFTLIEMLVVISIIAVIAGMAFPVTNTVLRKARIVRTQAALKDLQVAIKNYQTEYNRYPVAGAGGEDTDVLTDGSTDLLAVLLAEPDIELNRKQIKFIDLPMARNNMGGLIIDGSTYSLNDGWGNPYHVLMDTNYDNRLDNPDAQNEDPKFSSDAPPQLPIGVAVFSDGIDRTEYTKDDVVSWR